MPAPWGCTRHATEPEPARVLKDRYSIAVAERIQRPLLVYEAGIMVPDQCNAGRDSGCPAGSPVVFALWKAFSKKTDWLMGFRWSSSYRSAAGGFGNFMAMDRKIRNNMECLSVKIK